MARLNSTRRMIALIIITALLLGALPAAAQGPISDAQIVTSYLNMRAAPDPNAALVQQLSYGTLLTVQGRNADGSWLYVVTPANVSGWVATNWVALRNDLDVNALPVTDATGVPAAPAAPAADQAAAPAVEPAASSADTGGLALGGQILGYDQQAWMRTAGMTWVKRQVVYHSGDDAASYAGMIAEAHALGFQILLSVKGEPHQLADDPNYIQGFAAFLGGLAGLGADGIEVWNEMNIDREWPIGRIDPTWYVEMLAASYNAIKAANPATLVISGAPAPTGAEGAFGTDRVWNDDRYVQGMAAAGAAQYMDCIGIHYNEGIIGPYQTGGDPRGDYYTRYYGAMVDTYWNAFGGQRPLCFTELGYLSAEGYGALPGGFAWAAGVTVNQQAQWIAEAVALARGGDRVAMIIVWNVDFTGHWGDDPMGGYAIVRPGGGCPACEALARLGS